MSDSAAGHERGEYGKVKARVFFHIAIGLKK
jgi:hypothetical protein